MELRTASLVFVSGERVRELPIESLEDVRLTKGWPWCTLEIRLAGSESFHPFRGLPRWRAKAFLARLQQRRAGSLVAPANREFDALCDRDAYVRRSETLAWKARHQPLEARLAELFSTSSRTPAAAGPVAAFLKRLQSGEHDIASRNDLWVERELERQSEWFDGVAAHPLTPRQREAIVRDEDASLVVAGPGTGKTSTVLAKLAYLVDVRGVPADEILVLSFSRKTVAELVERASALLEEAPRIRTFHALGLDVIAAVTDKKPSLSPLAEDEQKLGEFLKACVEELLGDETTGLALRNFLIQHLRPARSILGFDSRKEYIQHCRSQDLRTYQGERVKSHEELMIANWLYCQGIAYEYEAKYEIDTATRQHAQYKPDFFLPEHGIYLEHFGVDREGRTAPWIDAEHYRESMEWKRALHREQDTTLLETYSYENSEGELLERLEEKLRAAGVEPRPIPEEQLRRALERRGETPRLVKLLASFLHLFRSSESTVEQLRSDAASHADARRALCFLDVFAEVLGRYEAHLAETGDIDFHDMIARASDYVRQGRFDSPYRYVVVDEYQDIAPGRCQLLRSLVAAHPGSGVFCVGDDCQAIYRFTGSDVALMTKFESHFGFTRRTELDRTFRLNAELLALSSAFIGRNPAQLPKGFEATRSLAAAAVTLVIEPAEAEPGTALAAALAEIAEHAAGETASLLVIGRYNFSGPEHLGDLLAQYPKLQSRFVTAHGSKGLEADYTIVLDVVSGRHGFPSEIADDPLLELVLSEPEAFAHAEERRLFYVALTRARQRSFVLTRATSPSDFGRELLEARYRGLVEHAGDAAERPVCPRCEDHTLVRRAGPHGEFWGCGNYPWCDARPKTCASCGEGAMLPQGDGFACSAPSCTESGRRCPRCPDGMLVHRTSQYGEFLGCTNFSRGLPPCRFIERL